MKYFKYGHGKWQQDECNKLIMKPAGVDIDKFTIAVIEQIMNVFEQEENNKGSIY